MIFDTIESVLKQRLDNSQLENFKETLINCKYGRLSHGNSKELRLELGLENGKVSPNLELQKKESIDTFSPKVSNSDASKSANFNKENEELKDSNDSKISHLFLTDILLSPEEKIYIESQDKLRRKIYHDKKREIERKFSKKLYEEPESLTKLKNQQKIFEQKTLILKEKEQKIEIISNHQDKIKPQAEPVTSKFVIQRDQEKEKHDREIEEIKKKFKISIDHLKSIYQKIELSQFRDAINKSIKESIQQSIQEIENILKFDEAKNLNFLRDLETKYSKNGLELQLRVDKEILEKKRLKEEEELRKKNEEQERVKKILMFEKFNAEILKYKTFVSELKTLNEKQDIELETKSNLVQNLFNESLLHQANNLKNFQENLINQIDAYSSLIDRNFGENFIETLNQDILNQTLKQFENDIGKFRAQTNEARSQIDKLQNAIQKSLNELVEAKKAKEKLEVENQKLKESKEREAKLEEKAIQERLAKEAELKKQEEEKKKSESFNQIKNVDENNKAGINKLTLEVYRKVETLFNQTRKESEDALNVKEFKIYKFELQKAINFPLNSLLGTENNGVNFDDKIKTLVRLLSGQTCKVTSTITADASKHPKAIDFCLVYLGRKIVEKGEETVASRPQTAFEYVQVIMEIMKTKIEFETILMGQFQERCPYIVPYYKAKNSSQSDQQYYESIGYKLIDGKIEEDVHFYKRMNGVFYLYFTLLIFGNSTYFSVKRAWQWLADVLNMTPRPNITAEMLTIFFKCCGYTLHKVYGKQFIKLVNIFFNDYFKLIRAISPDKQSNAVVGRLTNVLEHYTKYGRFDQWKKTM